ncbi:hypothetical protein JOD63_000422 [Microbacterium terrae]|uniref:Uncharacterized protein n=1 Tax=Microbacterium terrae TaxID=69369 RepID=A0A0M2GVR4_9MICO|nr:hypothetical protein [Microbacterium terrae]KJL37622.1 hypothetical protein RS81_03379 [Microbacterium terrae]MBP1076454.1 hypothetical protein [Microbacterium terrae]GLJ97283.1 hypothetical protein GCM10017594_04800 [Microbacterium terrae]
MSLHSLLTELAGSIANLRPDQRETLANHTGVANDADAGEEGC